MGKRSFHDYHEYDDNQKDVPISCRDCGLPVIYDAETESYIHAVERNHPALPYQSAGGPVISETCFNMPNTDDPDPEHPTVKNHEAVTLTEAEMVLYTNRATRHLVTDPARDKMRRLKRSVLLRAPNGKYLLGLNPWRREGDGPYETEEA